MQSNSNTEVNASNSFPTQITELLGQHISEVEKTDDDGVVQIYSYRHCTPQSPEELKKCRGLVFQGETKLFETLGFTPEYNVDSDKDFISNINFDNVTFYRSEEGTLIRVFYANGKWYTATNRKLDAFKSRWASSTTFGEIFEKALQNQSISSVTSLTDNLDPSNVYLFLVRNTTENRLVSKAPEQHTVFHVGTLVNGKTFTNEISVGVNHSSVLSFQGLSEVTDYVRGIDPMVHQGVIGFFADGSHFKILNSKYQLYSYVRGNEASVPFRYLQIRSNPTYVSLLSDLYPEKVEQFGKYEATIFRIAKAIHFAYMERFVNKKETVVSKEEYRIIRECHGWHISDRENHKVTLNVVLSTLAHPRFAVTLNALIKRHIS